MGNFYHTCSVSLYGQGQVPDNFFFFDYPWFILIRQLNFQSYIPFISTHTHTYTFLNYRYILLYFIILFSPIIESSVGGFNQKLKTNVWLTYTCFLPCWLTALLLAVQLRSCVWLLETPWTAAHQTSLSFTVSQSLLKLMSIESVMSSSHLIHCPPSPASPPALNLFQHQGLFKWVGSSYAMAKVLELQLQHQNFQWIFRTDFL